MHLWFLSVHSADGNRRAYWSVVNLVAYKLTKGSGIILEVW